MGTVITLPETPDGALRAVLGDLVDDVHPCAGSCGLRVLRAQVWKGLDKGKRARLTALRVSRVSSRGRCWKCTEVGGATTHSKNANRIPAELLAQLPEIWAEVRLNEGGPQELANRLGVSRERARQLVSKHDLPRTHTLVERAGIFLDELEHLAGLGMGVGYIASALGMTPEGLARKVNHLHQVGKTEVHFPGWYRPREKEEAEAA